MPASLSSITLFSYLCAFEPSLGLALELPDPLPRDLELLAYLGEGSGLPIFEAVAPDQDVTMALGEPLDCLLEGDSLHLAHHLASCVGPPLVLDELPDLRGVIPWANGPLRLIVGSGMASLASRTCSSFQSNLSATSSSVGSRSSSAESSLEVRVIFLIFSPMCAGIRIARPLSVTARPTACLIHQAT